MLHYFNCRVEHHCCINMNSRTADFSLSPTKRLAFSLCLKSCFCRLSPAMHWTSLRQELAPTAWREGASKWSLPRNRHGWPDLETLMRCYSLELSLRGTEIHSAVRVRCSGPIATLRTRLVQVRRISYVTCMWSSIAFSATMKWYLYMPWNAKYSFSQTELT